MLGTRQCRLCIAGVYADLDFESLRPLDELLQGHTAVVARMTDEEWDQASSSCQECYCRCREGAMGLHKDAIPKNSVLAAGRV